VSGIIASAFYLGTDLLAGKLLNGYSFSAQSMSDLGAAGSPTRPIFVPLTIIASAFLIAFGVGVWWATKPSVLPSIVAGLIIVNALATIIATLFFPNQYGVRPAFNTPGVILMFISVMCFVLAMLLGAFAFLGWMRIFSASIPIAYVLLAIIRFATVNASASGATTMIGSQERTMAYSFLLWVMALSIYLLVLTTKAVDSFNKVS
jgi:hypothetical membrane protein